MAVHRLPSIHMSSGFQDRTDATRKDRATTTETQHRMPDQTSWSRSPSHALKRSAYAFPLHEDQQQQHHQRHMQQSDMRMSFEGVDAVVSPSQRKRRRGDSDMSMSGRGSGASVSPSFGSVRITSSSIRALVHDDSDDADGRQRRSVTFEDVEFVGRDSWAGMSSRGSGRDSDLMDGMASPFTEKDQENASDRASVANATRNITFEMLQNHFSKPLKDAANHFGVCTTLLKKICRKNGILSWPYRQIIGLEKSIASMEQQVHYFDGEQRRQYAAQLRKLQIKLDAYIRTGQAPNEDELVAAMHTKASPTPLILPPTTESTHPFPQGDYHHHYHEQQQPPMDYYHTPQESVMASAVTLDAEEPPQRYETHARPSPSMTNHPYDQRYAATTYTSPTGYYAQRPLPSLASILNQSSQQHQSQPDHNTNAEHHWSR